MVRFILPNTLYKLHKLHPLLHHKVKLFVSTISLIIWKPKVAKTFMNSNVFLKLFFQTCIIMLCCIVDVLCCHKSPRHTQCSLMQQLSSPHISLLLLSYIFFLYKSLFPMIVDGIACSTIRHCLYANIASSIAYWRSSCQTLFENL